MSHVPNPVALGFGLAMVIVAIARSVRIVREYERGILFRFGNLVGAKGPGLFFLIPWVDRLERVDLRVVTVVVPKQESMTRDNVPVIVDDVVYFRVDDRSEERRVAR